MVMCSRHGWAPNVARQHLCLDVEGQHQRLVDQVEESKQQLRGQDRGAREPAQRRVQVQETRGVHQRPRAALDLLVVPLTLGKQAAQKRGISESQSVGQYVSTNTARWLWPGWKGMRGDAPS